MRNIKIPPNGDRPIGHNFPPVPFPFELISLEKNMIVVGANGSGKTRFGSRIEQLNNPSMRISAQRYLQISPTIQKQDFETANHQLRTNYKNKPPTQPQDDYKPLMVSLFAEEARRNERVMEAIDNQGKIDKEEVPLSAKDKVIDVWNSIFPYRPLKLEKDRAYAISESREFSANEMSDGEKVGLYLISQVLLAERNCILIIDEPELHLHKSLMVRLWNKLEEYRNDCTFIYITHDLDFAVSKSSSKLIWIKEYKNDKWTWSEIENNGVIPEDLFLEVLGSRTPVLFVEGEKGSLDCQIYQAYYDGFTIIPCGSCTKVIESVRGMRSNQHLHKIYVYGLIDRDFHSEEQLASLVNDGIFSIGLSEIENVFLVPEILELVCNHVGKPEKKEVVLNKIRDIYNDHKQQILFFASKFQIHNIINETLGEIDSFSDYEKRKKELPDLLDKKIKETILPSETGDIIEILKIYPHKGLVRQVQTELEFTKNLYQNLVLSFLTSEKKEEIKRYLSKYLPKIG